jgi:hypothetical protein
VWVISPEEVYKYAINKLGNSVVFVKRILEIMDPKKTEIELVERVEGGGQHVDIEKNISGPVDKALQVLKESHDQRPITAEDSNKVLRKIDLRILPFMLVAYTMQQVSFRRTIF